MEEVILLLLVSALLYIIFAVVQDLKTREIANWLNFSLVIFAIGIRFFYSLFLNDFSILYQGLIGLGIFFVLGNLFYYSRMFAGGDAKLMIALGAVLPVYPDFLNNVKIFLLFLFVFMFTGAIYGLIQGFRLSLTNWKNFKKEFSIQLKTKKKLTYLLFSLGFIVIVLTFFFLDSIFLLFGIFFLIIPYLFIYFKAVEQACMIKPIRTSMLTEGDLLCGNLKIGRRIIKARWDGLTKEEIKTIRKKYKKIMIKEGVPFSPVFLISFAIFVILLLLNISLWNSFW